MLTLQDGRTELWQWDTGRALTVDAECSQVHFSNKVFGRSIDVDVIEGLAAIPDILLQTDNELNVWAFVGTAENGYTKISKTFKVNRRNKPADYVFTPPDQTSIEEIKERLEYLEQNPIVPDLSNYATKDEIPDVSGFATKEEIPVIPEALPNPNALTFTGAVNATYDGSTAVSVEIPSGGSTDISLGITSAAIGQMIKVKAIDESGKPTEWEAANMPSGGGGGGHWETVLDTVWEQDVIHPTAFDSATGIFTCAEGELNNLELNTEYIFFQQCAKEGVEYITILNADAVKVTKLSDTTFSIDVPPSEKFTPTNIKFSRGACLTVTDIDAKKIRLTLDGQFRATATWYDLPFFGVGKPYFAMNAGYANIRNAYQAYQQVTAEVESPYRVVGEILCGFNAPSANYGTFHFKNNSFCCPLIPDDVPGNERNFILTSDGTKISKLYSTRYPSLFGDSNENLAISNDYLKIISGTKVKLERWVE